MNQEQVARIVSMVRTLYPHQRMDENPQNVVDAWSLVIIDLDFDEARAALVMHGRSGASWCSPGDIRKRVAKLRNVLSPAIDDLLLDMREVARRRGEGRKLLHAVARRVYDAAGGAPAINDMSARQLQELRRQLVDAASDYDEERMSSQQMPAAIEAYMPVTLRIEERASRGQIESGS